MYVSHVVHATANKEIQSHFLSPLFLSFPPPPPPTLVSRIFISCIYFLRFHLLAFTYSSPLIIYTSNFSFSFILIFTFTFCMIGGWANLMDMMGILGIICSAAILTFAEEQLIEYSAIERIIIFLVMQQVLVFFKYFIQSFLSDDPEWVQVLSDRNVFVR